MMKRKRLLLIPLIVSSLLTLGACSQVKDFFDDLLNEDALSFSNKYNPPQSTPEIDPNAVIAQDVIGKEIEDVPNALCFKNICYATDGKIANTYKTGGINHVEYNVNGGNDYSYSSKTNTTYDLYVPNSLDKNQKHVVILFIHGGAWISGFKSDVNQYVHEFARRGYITATIKYTLLKKTMDDASLSIFRDLDEIDACIGSIKAALEDLEFDTTKTNLVIGGASSGAHLSMLYSYSRGQRSPLPIKFVVDAVGPVDIKPENWKSFKYYSGEEAEYEAALTAGLSYSAIEAKRSEDRLADLRVADNTSSYNWNEYQTMRIANGMCGLPYSLSQVEASTDDNKEAIVNPNAASESMTKAGGGEDQLSVTYWMNSTYKLPIICAYAGKDSIVGVAQYAKLEKALDDNGIQHEYYYFKNSNHTDITPTADETAYNGFVNKIDDWCKAI